MSRHPEVKWAQSVDKVYITVLLADAKDTKVKLEPDGTFSFSATAGSGNSLYELKLDLQDKVDVAESKINTGVRNIFCVVEKTEKRWWKKLLRDDVKTPHYVKVDWDKWVDEDEDPPADLNMGGMDLSKFDMGGMGMNMDDDLVDSDDEEQESEKTQNLKETEDGGETEEAASEIKHESAQIT